MARKALEDVQYEKIKSHILYPDNSPLSVEHQRILERIVSAAKLLDKNPIQKNAVSLHMRKFPEIGRTRAYMDVRMAMKLFNTIHEFDFDFWQQWMINNIVENIQRARDMIGSSKAEKQIGALLRVIAMEHANLIKAIGEKPPEVTDPRLNEKHDFYILVQVNNGSSSQEIKIDHSKIKDLPPSALTELNKYLFAGKDITDVEAEEIMSS